MKKTLVTVCAVFLAVFTLQSCKTSQQMSKSALELEGEWNIIEIDGSSVVPADHQPFPFVGFNTENKQFFGSSGCNRMTGVYTLGKKAGQLDLGRVAGTMMMCPDMKLEEQVLNMLGRVKRFEVRGDQIALLGKSSKPIAMLDKKPETTQATLLSAKWSIKSVNAKNVREMMAENGQNPFIELDLDNKSISGNAGCNRIMGQIVENPGVEKSMTFPNVAATRMACPQLELEGVVLEALNKVATYKLSPSNTQLTLLDKNGAELMILVKL